MQRSDVAEDTGPGWEWPSERDGDSRAKHVGEWEACVVVCLDMGLVAWVMVWLG
jgi:hypothetical protein